jgi:hypothetical protein
LSTLAYGTLTTKREEAAPGTSSAANPPGIRTYVDALAALVPAEVLAAHALLLTWVSETSTNAEGMKVATITDPSTLKLIFWALVFISAGLYLLGRRRDFRRWDAARAVIPPLAFTFWTMLQKTTAFDAVWPSLREAPRNVVAVLGAVALGAAATALAYKADNDQPS